MSFGQPQAPTLLWHCPLLTSVTNAEKVIHFLTTPHPFREGSCHFSQVTAPFLFLASVPVLASHGLGGLGPPSSGLEVLPRVERGKS